MIDRDHHRYASLVSAMGSLSRLFSENDSPYIDSRFVERVFSLTTGARDLGRLDISFDAAIGDIGVGVKTFLAGSGKSKREKIAEFTTLARTGYFAGLDGETLAKRVVQERNNRVLSHANQVGVDVSRSWYHCLIRVPGGAIVHEEPYSIIDVDSLRPTDSSGKVLKSWKRMKRGLYFTDGKNQYSFSIAKNVLMKKFEFDRKKNFIPIQIDSDPIKRLERIRVSNITEGRKKMSRSLRNQKYESLFDTDDWRLSFESDSVLIAGKDYVVLPLYSIIGGRPYVHLKSGLNQWNANGENRQRKLGEAYVRIPSEIHQYCPGFFPDRDTQFNLFLQNRTTSVSAKVCQSGSKALMTCPNSDLGKWLLRTVSPIELNQDAIFDAVIDPKNPVHNPITYDDLLRIGKDCVKVFKHKVGSKYEYAIEFADIGEYEDFVAAFN
jgi:hypothetical protein